jgi:hypothetical protein
MTNQARIKSIAMLLALATGCGGGDPEPPEFFAIANMDCDFGVEGEGYGALVEGLFDGLSCSSVFFHLDRAEPAVTYTGLVQYRFADPASISLELRDETGAALAALPLDFGRGEEILAVVGGRITRDVPVPLLDVATGITEDGRSWVVLTTVDGDTLEFPVQACRTCQPPSLRSFED